MIAKRRHIGILFSGILSMAASQLAVAQDHIRITSFNIADFGSSESNAYERSIVDLVNILRKTDADLICLQEVQPGDFGEKQVARLVKWLNKAAKHEGAKFYDYVVSVAHTGDEVVAFIFRDPVSLASDMHLLEHGEDVDGDGKPAFHGDPSWLAQVQGRRYTM